jgi:hypothetical protein
MFFAWIQDIWTTTWIWTTTKSHVSTPFEIQRLKTKNYILLITHTQEVKLSGTSIEIKLVGKFRSNIRK